MSDLKTPCTEIEVAEALHLASLMGKDTQLVKVIRRLAYERDIANNLQMKPSLIADQLADIEQRLAVIYAEKEALIKKTVDECDHPIEAIYERPYQDNSWLGYEKPWLICSKCGYTEEGWGCGYKLLRHADHKDTPVVTREQWSSMRTIQRRQQHS